MAHLMALHGPCRLGSRPRVSERFASLARAIVYQQLAGAAAGAIWARVLLVVGGDCTAAGVLDAGTEALRGAGLSAAKTAAMVDLAERDVAGSLGLAGLGRLSDEEVIAGLVKVRGIGPWTAQMFLMFTLHRLDVWPVGDLGVRRGFSWRSDSSISRHPQRSSRPARSSGLSDPSRPGTAGGPANASDMSRRLDRAGHPVPDQPGHARSIRTAEGRLERLRPRVASRLAPVGFSGPPCESSPSGRPTPQRWPGFSVPPGLCRWPKPPTVPVGSEQVRLPCGRRSRLRSLLPGSSGSDPGRTFRPVPLELLRSGFPVLGSSCGLLSSRQVAKQVVRLPVIQANATDLFNAG